VHVVDWKAYDKAKERELLAFLWGARGLDGDHSPWDGVQKIRAKVPRLHPVPDGLIRIEFRRVGRICWAVAGAFAGIDSRLRA